MALGLSRFQNTIEQLENELITARESGDQVQVADVLNRLGIAYLQQSQPNKAIESFKESMSINESVGNTRAIAVLSSSIGMAYNDLSDYTSAETYLQQSIDTYQSMGNKRQLCGEYLNLANVRKYARNFEGSNTTVTQGLTLAKELDNRNLISSFYLILSENYRDLGDTEQSMKAFENYQIIRSDIDRTAVQESQQQANNAQQQIRQQDRQLQNAQEVIDSTRQELSAAQRLAELQEQQIKMADQNRQLMEENSENLEKALAADRKIIWLVLMAGILILFILFVVLRGLVVNRRKNAILATQNNEIHQQKIELMVQRDKIRSKSVQLEEAISEIKDINHKITSSINYAKRIQEAMLPTRASIKEHLPKSFILFKPRDIVSGDFYWFAHLENQKKPADTRTILTAVDCTGHGVPGAFMSMIGAELLNKIVLMQGLNNPGSIVTELHKQVRAALRQETTENRDGMDLALLSIHPDGKTIEYSGAQNPLIYIQDNEIFQVKATRFSVGGIQKEDERIYENHTFTFDKPTWVYLFSDGYADQFGGDAGRKFMIKRLKNLLLEIHQKPMQDQHDILNDTIENWRGDFNQIDDILVIGLKVG